MFCFVLRLLASCCESVLCAFSVETCSKTARDWETGRGDGGGTGGGWPMVFFSFLFLLSHPVLA